LSNALITDVMNIYPLFTQQKNHSHPRRNAR
jgi:hypothetical protein